MSDRYRLFRRSNVFYAQDNLSGKQESLRTRDRREAQRLLDAKNDAIKTPHLGMALAKAYLSALDPQMVKRTWSQVMEQFKSNGKASTQARSERAFDSKSFDLLRNKLLIETNSEDFLAVLRCGGTSVNHYLRRLHNLAIGLGWLVSPILPPKFWPKVTPKTKRAITQDEHLAIIAAEQNVERRLYYELLWATGAAQSDAVALSSENVDRTAGTLVYTRCKTGQQATLQIGAALDHVLKQLPTQGLFFPRLSALSETDRSAEFSRRCRLLKISGISLHSYRYAWAERAKTCGYPERWAQAALGHNSRAVHQAYAKGAKVICPALDDYEKKIIPLPREQRPSGEQDEALRQPV